MRIVGASASLLLCLSCSPHPVDRIASGYVSLVNAVDRSEATVENARALRGELAPLAATARTRHLERQLDSLVGRLEIVAGRKTSFDEESQLLYGVVAQKPDEDETRKIRDELEKLLPGEGTLAERYALYQRRFLIPTERLDEVLERALEESRRRTRQHLDLPGEERVRLEYVTGKPWPSFTSYSGDYESVVEVNRDFPITIGSAVEIAAHEAYPGHHTANVILERDRVRARGQVEFSVEPLVGPDAVLREGLAQYGVELCFPADERLLFEKDVLFPMSGLSTADAERYDRVERLVHRLSGVAVDGARQYLDRKRDRVASAIWLESEALVPDPWAFLRFVDRYRTYVVAYALGEALVRREVERHASDPWSAFSLLISDRNDAT